MYASRDVSSAGIPTVPRSAVGKTGNDSPRFLSADSEQVGQVLW
jgi:hypothetical protein